MLIFIARAASCLVLGNVKHFVRNQSYPSEEFQHDCVRITNKVGIVTSHHLYLRELEYIFPEATPNGYGKSGKSTRNLVLRESFS